MPCTQHGQALGGDTRLSQNADVNPQAPLALPRPALTKHQLFLTGLNVSWKIHAWQATRDQPSGPSSEAHLAAQAAAEGLAKPPSKPGKSGVFVSVVCACAESGSGYVMFCGHEPSPGSVSRRTEAQLSARAVPSFFPLGRSSPCSALPIVKLMEVDARGSS